MDDRFGDGDGYESGGDGSENGSDGYENGGDDVRYGLTALGASHLDERRSFMGFGPCSAMRPSEAVEKSSATGRRRIGRQRVQRATPLFG